MKPRGYVKGKRSSKYSSDSTRKEYKLDFLKYRITKFVEKCIESGSLFYKKDLELVYESIKSRRLIKKEKQLQKSYLIKLILFAY